MRVCRVAVALIGCAPGLAAPPPTPHGYAADAAPAVLHKSETFHAIAGETMEYAVTLRGFTVGHVVVAVGEPGEVAGKRALVVRSRGTGGGIIGLFGSLTWELTSTLALDDGHVLQESEIVDATFAGKHEHETHQVGESSEHNVHSAAGVMRAWRSEVGETQTLDVRISDFVVDVAVTDAAREMRHDMPAVRYEGAVRGTYRVTIWISDDEARVPLELRAQTKWGELAVELTTYDAGTSP